ASFEIRLKEKERENSKFSFLNDLDPYRGYYEYCLFQIEEGKFEETKLEEEKDLEKEKLEERLVAPPEPPNFDFLLQDVVSQNIVSQDLEIIRLTALFVARNGKQFMLELQKKEQKNFQFDFLKPSHSLFFFFGKLVEQYQKILIPSQKNFEKLDLNLNKLNFFESRCLVRYEWEKYNQLEKEKNLKKLDLEKAAYDSIDWHQFMILDTIEFSEADEQLEFPLPLSLMDLENMSLLEKSRGIEITQLPIPKINQNHLPNGINNNTATAGNDMEEDDGEDMEMDDDDEPPKKQMRVY
ncbi:SF3a splicing factor complex subunit, partial [Clydaea vesicula]